MSQRSTHVGLDVHKKQIAVALLRLSLPGIRGGSVSSPSSLEMFG